MFKAITGCNRKPQNAAPQFAANGNRGSQGRGQSYQTAEQLDNARMENSRMENNRMVQQRAWNNERSSQELQARDRATKSYVDQQVMQNAQLWNNNDKSGELTIREGVMRPIWIEGKLILARQVDMGTKVVVQCCWLDWEKLEKRLLAQISDSLPNATFRPLLEDNGEIQFGRVLATLPVEIVAGLDNLPIESIETMPPELEQGWFSGIRLSLMLPGSACC